MTHHADSLKTWCAIVTAYFGAVTVNDVAIFLGVILTAVRLPIEIHNLYTWFKKVSRKCPNRNKRRQKK